MQPARPKRTSLASAKDFSNPQLCLFQQLLCNKEEERQKLSNAIELWDCMPRYSVSRAAMNEMRDANGYLGLLKLAFEFRGVRFTIQIQPALIEDKKTGKTIAYYPSSNEDLVEQALRKLAIDQDKGFYDVTSSRYGVMFSLYQLREELSRCGHTRSFDEIKMSLDILSGSSIQIAATTEKSHAFAKSNYFPLLVGVTRKELKDDPNARWLVQFHPLVSDAIDKLNYRQYNYHQLMQHSTQLARWLHKILISKFVMASAVKPFVIHFTTIFRDSALLNNYSRHRKAVEACDFSIGELKENGVIRDIDRRVVPGQRGKILDIVYTLWPSTDFVKEVKAALCRQNEDRKLSTVAK